VITPWTPEKKRLLFSAALGGVGLVLGWTYLYTQEQDLLHRGQTIAVVAASHTLPAYALLTRRDLQVIDLPLAYVPRSAVAKAEDILGQRTLVPFAQGELLLFNKIGQEGVTLASAVPEGTRAVSLAMDEVTGLAGLLQPGDSVDLFSIQAEAQPQAGVLLQQVHVLAVGTRTTHEKDPEGAKAPSTVTLAVPESEVALVLLASAKSALHLALRAPGDERPLSQSHAAPADLLHRLGQAPAHSPVVTADSADDFIPHKR
jgi:pilus assembly protein CpaB